MPAKPPAGERDCIEYFLSQPSEESFRALFRAVAPRIACYFRARGCDSGLAEDLTQDVMLSVYKSSGGLRNRNLFRPWVYRIAKNALLRHLRQAGRRVETVEFGEQAEELCATSTDPLAQARFTEWMAWLNPDEREIMTLRFVDQLELHEIASALGMPLGTVQWKVYHAKRKLAAYLGDGQTS